MKNLLIAIFLLITMQGYCPDEPGKHLITLGDFSKVTRHWENVSVKDRLQVYQMFLDTREGAKKYWLPEIYETYTKIIIL